MLPDDLPAVFVTHAAAILGDTNRGLSGAETVRLTATYAIDANVSIPFASYPFAGPLGTNKRTALFKNLMAFPSNWRYKIIRDLCDHRLIQQSSAAEASKLKAQRVV